MFSKNTGKSSIANEEYKQLEKNIVENGFDKNFPIMVWHDFIVDGHNRYEICEKHGIDFVYGKLGYETKEEVIEWMFDIQLGRRNLSPIQRIAVMEKKREYYERKAKEKQSEAGGDKKSDDFKKSLVMNSSQAVSDNSKRNPTVRKILSDMAGVSEDTYSKGKKILESNDEDSKLRALISNNFGRRKNDPTKDRKALETYVSLRGYKHGELGNGGKKRVQNGLSKITLDEIAKELNMSKSNLKRALRIERNLTDSMKELLEDEILADLIETNIRQRGIGNPNPVKLGRCIKELERIYGVRDGSANKKGNNRIGEPKVSDDQLSQSDIADMIGISVDTLSNYKKLTEMIPELEELVDTGIAIFT